MIEDVIDSSKPRLFNLKELWKYRELFYFFTWRDIKIRYKQTILGFLWAIVQPLLLMIITSLVFGQALKIPPQNLPYPVFVISGLVIWNLFANGLTGASTSMVNNALIIKKIYFPRLVVPVAAVLTALFDFAMAFILLIAVLIYYKQPVDPIAILYWPVAIICAITATIGLGSWMAALNVKYRDIRYVIPFLIQVLFFLSPVLYPISMLKYPVLQYILVSSPLYAAIELFRSPLNHVVPDTQYILISMSSSIVLLFIGLIYFRRTESFFADLA
jgi:lipopolysaccharide transport system permease protein